jgi:hypothetical protein
MSILIRTAALLMVAVVVLAAVPDLRAEGSLSLQDAVLVFENKALRVTVDPQAGNLKVEDKASGHVWQQQKLASASGELQRRRFRDARELAGPEKGLTYIADFGASGGKPNTLTVTLKLPGDHADLSVEADMPERTREIGDVPFLDPFVLDSPAGVFAVADYSNGHLYPLDPKELPRRSFSGSRLDMPWVGMCDLDRGFGYAMILETPDDASVRLQTGTGVTPATSC